MKKTIDKNSYIFADFTEEKDFVSVDRFLCQCPECGIGRNNPEQGGNKTCFHCDNCGWTECVDDDFDPRGFLKIGETKVTETFKKMFKDNAEMFWKLRNHQ